MTTRETQAQRIVRIFGGLDRMSKGTTINRHTISSWLKSGYVPHKYWQDLLYRAARLGIDHTPWDYIAHLVDPIAEHMRTKNAERELASTGNGARS